MIATMTDGANTTSEKPIAASKQPVITIFLLPYFVMSPSPLSRPMVMAMANPA
jgi:hypothetical protein